MVVAPGKIWDFIMHGMGRDWDNKIQYLEVKKPSFLSYKHFSDKFGIFGGPGLNLVYGFGKSITNPGSAYYETKSNQISFNLEVGAGAYYVLNERWWLTGSLAFSNPLYLSYKFGKSEPFEPGPHIDNSGFEYKLSPDFNFPSVGLGLRYFFKD